MKIVTHKQFRDFLRQCAMPDATIPHCTPFTDDATYNMAVVKGFNFSPSRVKKQFRHITFYGICFINCNLGNCEFVFCTFDHCTFNYCIMNVASFHNCTFEHCNVNECNFNGSILNATTFTDSSIHNTMFNGASISGYTTDKSFLFVGCFVYLSNFTNASISPAPYCTTFYDPTTVMGETNAGVRLVCPEEGSFIAFKKARSRMRFATYDSTQVIVKLEIPASAKRSSATTRKCRCSEAKVLGFYDTKGCPISPRHPVRSAHSVDFIYNLGETVYVHDFDENRWHECAEGIHFFMTFEEAAQYTI